jgi:hypothetical protein
MEIFAHASEFTGTPPTVRAKSLLALSLVQMLFAIEKQLALYRQQIEEPFARQAPSCSEAVVGVLVGGLGYYALSRASSKASSRAASP